MTQQPGPPRGLPQYLAEGVPKQEDDTLRALQEWVDEPLACRQDIVAEDIDAADGEPSRAIEESSNGTVVIEKFSCGKDNCKCQRDKLHQQATIGTETSINFRIETLEMSTRPRHWYIVDDGAVEASIMPTVA